jgi:hypothetical protein
MAAKPASSVRAWVDDRLRGDMPLDEIANMWICEPPALQRFTA